MVTDISKLSIRSPFCDLFPIDPNVQAAVKENMEQVGFDLSKPIDVWNIDPENPDGYTVIDGHTRLNAAREIGIEQVPIFCHPFDTESEALEYAIHNQRDRRNMTASDIVRCVEALNFRKRPGPKNNSGSTEPEFESGSSAAQMATTIGVSPATVKRARTIIDYADEETKEALQSGELSIRAAYDQTQERRRHERKQSEAKPTFNRTNENIEWAAWSWNPVTGCKHGCEYCYARDIANRFYPQGFEPTYHPERLTAPLNTKPINPRWAGDIGHKGVFVCSMADLFGAWIPQQWIDSVMFAVENSPQWNFLFLTKYPKRLTEIKWPQNAWVGTTVDIQARVAIAEEAFSQIQAPVKFLSCEPLQEQLTFSSLRMFDWVIIGGRSKNSKLPEFQPPFEWVEHLQGQARASNCKIYWKDNLKSRPREYPELQ